MEIYRPGRVDAKLLKDVLGEFNLAPENEILMLPHGDVIARECRHLYFWGAVDEKTQKMGICLAQNEDIPKTRIISVGRCNAACPYCKRDCQFITGDGVPIAAVPVSLLDIAAICEGAVARNEIPRFSGGDPVMYHKQVLALAKYLFKRHGVRSSIAHNGSASAWVTQMIPYLSSAAIDLKAVPEKIGEIMGVGSRGPVMYQRSLDTQHSLSSAGVFLDVRTPVFGDTSIEEMFRLAGDIIRVNSLSHTFWTWRLYKPVMGCEFQVPDRDIVVGMMKEISVSCPNLWMGLRAKWVSGGMLFVRNGEGGNNG